VSGRQVLVQQRLAAQAVDRPEVLVRSDVREVPHQRAHERVERPLDVFVRQALDKRERRRPRLLELMRQVERGPIHGAKP